MATPIYSKGTSEPDLNTNVPMIDWGRAAALGSEISTRISESRARQSESKINMLTKLEKMPHEIANLDANTVQTIASTADIRSQTKARLDMLPHQIANTQAQTFETQTRGVERMAKLPGELKNQYLTNRDLAEELKVTIAGVPDRIKQLEFQEKLNDLKRTDQALEQVRQQKEQEIENGKLDLSIGADEIKAQQEGLAEALETLTLEPNEQNLLDTLNLFKDYKGTRSPKIKELRKDLAVLEGQIQQGITARLDEGITEGMTPEQAEAKRQENALLMASQPGMAGEAGKAEREKYLARRDAKRAIDRGELLQPYIEEGLALDLSPTEARKRAQTKLANIQIADEVGMDGETLHTATEATRIRQEQAKLQGTNDFPEITAKIKATVEAEGLTGNEADMLADELFNAAVEEGAQKFPDELGKQAYKDNMELKRLASQKAKLMEKQQSRAQRNNTVLAGNNPVGEFYQGKINHMGDLNLATASIVSSFAEPTFKDIAWEKHDVVVRNTEAWRDALGEGITRLQVRLADPNLPSEQQTKLNNNLQTLIYIRGESGKARGFFHGVPNDFVNHDKVYEIDSKFNEWTKASTSTRPGTVVNTQVQGKALVAEILKLSPFLGNMADDIYVENYNDQKSMGYIEARETAVKDKISASKVTGRNLSTPVVDQPTEGRLGLPREQN